MKRLYPLSIIALYLLAGRASADAPSSTPAPATATMCAGCHGPDGNSPSSTVPKLAGQGQDYLIKELVDFTKPDNDRSGRPNPIMSGMAATLSPSDRRTVAAYFSKQAPAPEAGSEEASLKGGARLYRTGDAEKNVPACAGCHGPTGAGLPGRYPRIGAQHRDYLEVQLKAFRAGTRHNNPPMQEIAFRMTDDEIAAVAAFASSLKPR